MATIRKRGSSWQAIVNRKGVYVSESSPIKAHVVAWAKKIETEIEANKFTGKSNKTFADLLEAYGNEYSIKNEGGNKEIIRFNMYKRLYPDLMEMKLSALDSHVMATMWRDKRAAVVKPGSLRREWNTLSAVFNTAVKQYKWMNINPLNELSRPAAPEPRDRRITDNEIIDILACMGYKSDEYPKTIAAKTGAIWLFALETAMRQKEMCILKWGWVDLEKRTVSVPKLIVEHTKTGHRKIPLTLKAVTLIEQMLNERTVVDSEDLVFGLSEAQVSSNFRKYRDRALVKGLTFHDSKHEAVTRLASKVRIEDLSRIVGTRSLKILMGYYNRSAEDIAKDLN